MRIGVLTAGGDCPGLNAVIRSVVHRAVAQYGDEVIGFEDGYAGLLDGRYRTLDLEDVGGILARGGTILGSSRLQRDRLREACENAQDMAHRFGIDVLIPIGGEGTLTAARMLSDAGLPVVGVPKTIDNDISSTDRTFGFDTAVGVATEAMDRLKTTAESHQRVMVVEVMGRHAGWIALESGMAAGAHGICLPERAFDPADLVKMVEERFSRGKKFAVICVAEGAHPAEGSMDYGHGEIDQFGHERFPGHRHGTGVRTGAPPRQGGQAGHSRARPARRHPDRVRQGARHALRLARGRGRAPGRLRPYDRPARHRGGDGAAGGGGDRTEDGAEGPDGRGGVGVLGSRAFAGLGWAGVSRWPFAAPVTRNDR